MVSHLPTITDVHEAIETMFDFLRNIRKEVKRLEKALPVKPTTSENEAP